MLSAKHIKAYERKYVGIMNEHHFAQRIAGSGCGKHSVCDIISVEDGEVFLDELKSTSADKLVLDSKTKEQLQKMMDKAKKHPPLKARLVIHWKRRGWETIPLDTMPKSPIRYNPK